MQFGLVKTLVRAGKSCLVLILSVCAWLSATHFILQVSQLVNFLPSPFLVLSQVSTHGYSQNQILIWKYPSLAQVAQLTGHSYRVLYLAMSPDGESIVTGAGDETLRFWSVFNKTRSQKVNRFF